MTQKASEWVKNVIRQDEIDRYLVDGKDYIETANIEQTLLANQEPDPKRIREILQKSLDVKLLSPDETAALLQVKDPELWKEMEETALEVKRKVYDNRIVFFAPLYCSNLCVNNCAYCGFREENNQETRRILTMNEVRQETCSVLNEGHKRMILVFGEHPRSDIDYMCDVVRNVYDVQETAPVSGRPTAIRRVNINAAPLEIAKLKKLWDAGIGTYQVFQETYHRPTFEAVHPANTIKGNYRWRMYALHRAMEAGIDDVAIGALFGLHDWRYEVMGLIHHTHDLERAFGVGPHTISFPRLTPASGSDLSISSKHMVSDDDFKKLVTVLRLAVPYAGLIVTAREKAELKKEVFKLGVTQTDASTKIGIGAYSETKIHEQADTEQFTIGDPRSLDEVIRELAEMGMISSFCTAGYRCGRTGDKIMGMIKHCVEGKFCKLNAVLTYREFLNDYASPETKVLGEKVIEQELRQIDDEPYFRKGNILNKFKVDYKRIQDGERDIYL